MTQITLTHEEAPDRTTADRPPAPPPEEPQVSRRPDAARPRVSHRINMVKVVMGLAIWSLPMLRPAGPGNTAPADLFLGLAILFTALWFASRRQVMRFPYMFPVGLSILAGALASTVAYRHAYVSVGGGLVSLIQDAFLLAWCIGIANAGRDPALLRSMARAWAISATCWAALMIFGYFGHISALSGQDARTGIRAAFTLGDANLAANYFVCSLLVLRAMRYPQRRKLRWFCCALLVTAVALTGSNGGMLVLIITTAAGGIFRMARHRSGTTAVIAAAGLLAAVLAIGPHVSVQSIVAKAQSSGQFLNNSIGHAGESSGSRSLILSQTEELYLTWDNLLGIGPGGTKGAFQGHGFSYVKMAHDDYAASLVERGVLGSVALVCLILIVLARCRRIAVRGLRPRYASIFPRPELLGAAVIAMFISAFFYQVLHFRHLWALLGLVAAVDLWGRRDSQDSPADEPEADYRGMQPMFGHGLTGRRGTRAALIGGTVDRLEPDVTRASRSPGLSHPASPSRALFERTSLAPASLSPGSLPPVYEHRQIAPDDDFATMLFPRLRELDAAADRGDHDGDTMMFPRLADANGDSGGGDGDTMMFPRLAEPAGDGGGDTMMFPRLADANGSGEHDYPTLQLPQLPQIPQVPEVPRQVQPGADRMPAPAQARPKGIRGRITKLIPSVLTANVAARVVALVSLSAATVLVAHAGGPKLLGELTLLRVLPGLAGVLAGCGLPSAAPFFLAGKGRDKARLRTTIIVLTLAGALAASGGWLVLSPIIHRLFFHSWHMGVVIAAAVPVFSQLWVATGKAFLQGEDDMRGANWAIAAEEAAFLPVYVALVPIMHGTSLLMTALVAADVVVTAGIAVRLARRGYLRGWGRFDLGQAREICGYGLRGQVGGMLSLVNLRLDVVILGGMVGPGTLGVYAVASKYAELLRLPGLAITYVLYPRLTARDAKDAARYVAALFPRALVLTALAALPLAAAVPLLPDVYGHAFLTAIIPAYILLFGLIGEGVAGLVSAYLYAVGRPGANSLALTVSVLVTIVGDVTLIPPYHAIGAAIASAAAYLTSSGALLVCYFVVRKLPPKARPDAVPADAS
ncbi:MAG TPA: oligosaccharide flippase family protein [Streptosporangiaceae bacterium]|nr:oligosaccharide flippase family protein [Streptosporangiaceae bacterium]